MSEHIVREVIFAIKRQRDVYEARSATKEAELFDRYRDSLWEALGVADGGTRTPSELKQIRMDMFAISDPFLLDRIMPFPRSRIAYRAVMKLAKKVSRVERGLPPHRFFGLLR